MFGGWNLAKEEKDHKEINQHKNNRRAYIIYHVNRSYLFDRNSYHLSIKMLPRQREGEGEGVTNWGSISRPLP